MPSEMAHFYISEYPVVTPGSQVQNERKSNCRGLERERERAKITESTKQTLVSLIPKIIVPLKQRKTKEIIFLYVFSKILMFY